MMMAAARTEKKSSDFDSSHNLMGVWTAIGLGAGAAVGAAMGDIAVGAAIGGAVGIIIAGLLSFKKVG